MLPWLLFSARQVQRNGRRPCDTKALPNKIEPSSTDLPEFAVFTVDPHRCMCASALPQILYCRHCQLLVLVLQMHPASCYRINRSEPRCAHLPHWRTLDALPQYVRFLTVTLQLNGTRQPSGKAESFTVDFKIHMCKIWKICWFTKLNRQHSMGLPRATVKNHKLVLSPSVLYAR